MLRKALLTASSTQGNEPPTPLYDEREIRSIIDLLLEEVCGITRIDRLLHPQLRPTEAQRQQLAHCAEILAHGHPVQQALGYEWFCGRKFFVTPDVLIPRPETAELISWIQSSTQEAASSRPLNANTPENASSPHPIHIIDMGTGSGCIAITLAQVIHHAEVLAIDLSTEALSIARCNACEQHVDNLQFAQCDILRCVDNSYFEHAIKASCAHYSPSYPQPMAFDVIVSNPPYICRREAAEMSPLVLDNEPDLALFVPDDDPLLFYRAIARFARQHLAPQGQLFFEINAAYGTETKKMLQEEGFPEVIIKQDVNGRDRMIRAQYARRNG